MLRIRLRRVGAKGQPAYRIVVADSRSPRDGRFVEVIGHYNPLTDPPTVEVPEDRLEYWQGVGATCSESVERILRARARLASEDSGEEAPEPEATEPGPPTEPSDESIAATE